MSVHAEKLPASGRGAAAQSDAEQRSRGEGGWLQEMANSGRQSMQLRALSELASNSPRSRQVAQLQLKSDVVQRTVWEWTGTYWNAVRTEGSPTAQPSSGGSRTGQRISTGTETDLWATGNVQPTRTAPPSGFTLVSNQMGSMQAYLSDPNGLAPSGVPLDHLVEAANGISSRIHRSSKMSGTSHQTYVHPNDDQLYTFSLQGNHSDSIPKITIHEEGKVRGGVHKF